MKGSGMEGASVGSKVWRHLEQLGLELKGGERAERAPTRGHLWVCVWIAGVRR